MAELLSLTSVIVAENLQEVNKHWSAFIQEVIGELGANISIWDLKSFTRSKSLNNQIFLN